MTRLLRQGLESGGIGFSTSYGRTHFDGDGKPVPSRKAGRRELLALAECCGEVAGTSLEFLPPGGDFSEDTSDLFATMSVTAQRPLNWNPIRSSGDSLESDRKKLGVSSQAEARDGKVIAMVMPIDFPARLCFDRPFILESLPSWGDVMSLPAGDRKLALLNQTTRRELESAAALDTSRRDLTDWGSKEIVECFSSDLKRYEGRRVSDVATEEGKRPFDALLDIVCADELLTTFTRLKAGDTAADWEARREIWSDPRAIVGASDAGAHVDCVATFNYPTYLLSRTVRDAVGLSLEEALRMLTGRPAELYGLRGRGKLDLGSFADIVIFDEDQVGSDAVVTRFDLPAGAGRLYAEAVGVRRVLVNGQEVVDGGVFTNIRPGRVLRSGQDTYTPTLRF